MLPLKYENHASNGRFVPAASWEDLEIHTVTIRRKRTKPVLPGIGKLMQRQLLQQFNSFVAALGAAAPNK